MRKHLVKIADGANVIAIMACLVLAVPAVAIANPADQGSLQQLSALAASQRESLAKIKSYEITITEHTTYNSNDEGFQPFTRTTEHHECTRGQDSRVERTEHTVSKGKNGEHANDDQWRMVVNDRYLADWLVGTRGAFVWHCDSPAVAQPSSSAQAVRENSRSPIRYGFGDKDGLLTDLYNKALEHQVANLCVSKNQSLYVIKYADIKNASAEELTVDSAKGYLITHSVYSQNGLVSREMSVEPKEVEPGVWFPSVWEVTEYNIRAKVADKPAVVEHSRNELQSVKINPHFSDDTFTLKALKLGPSVRIAYQDPTGKAPTQFITQAAYVKRLANK